MANSNTNKRAASLYAPVLTALLGSAQGAAPTIAPSQSELPIVIDAAGAPEIDFRNNTLQLKDVVISQGQLRIRADQAAAKADGARTTNADNFQNSRWTLSSKVHITTPDGHLTADKAIVVFADNQINELHISGSPATFEQHDAEKQTLAKGTAGTIDYDFKQNTVRLSDKAWLSYGQNECRAVAFVYNITRQVVSARPEDQQGQRINCTATQKSLRTLAEREQVEPKSDAAKPQQ